MCHSITSLLFFEKFSSNHFIVLVHVRFSVKLHRLLKSSIVLYGGCIVYPIERRLPRIWCTDCEIIGTMINNVQMPPLPYQLVKYEHYPMLVYDNQNQLMFIGSEGRHYFFRS